MQPPLCPPARHRQRRMVGEALLAGGVHGHMAPEADAAARWRQRRHFLSLLQMFSGRGGA